MKSSPSRTARRLLILASILLIVHGVIELLSLLWLVQPPTFTFAFEELGRSFQATMLVGVVSGLLRIAAAAGILADRMWGWALGVLMAAVTFAMLTFYLPAGAADALLAGGALVLLLVGRFQGAAILGEKTQP